MNTSLGVWIDKTKARIISSEKIVGTIFSDIEIRPRYEGEGKSYGRFGDQYMTMEKSKQKRLQQQESLFLKKVKDELKTAEGIVIFGPAQTKNKLKHLLQESHSTKDIPIDVITTEKMTDNQLVAFVREHFEDN